MQKSTDIKYEIREESMYPFLQQQSKAHLHKLSGQIWTDQYVHDPGVTINDVLNYMLADFNYKLQFPIEDYLCTEKNTVNLEALGLFNISQISLFEPVTIIDYQNLISKHVPDIYKIIFIPLKEENKIGLYKIEAFVYPDVEKSRYENLGNIVKKLFYNHRNFCEDIEEVNILYADASIERKQSIDFKDLLDNDKQTFPKGQFRDMFEHLPARFDFPKFYGINDWGLSPDATEERKRQANQLKIYLDLFDGVIKRGLAELKSLPQNLNLADSASTEKNTLIVMQYLDMLDKMYGVDSNPDFIVAPDGMPERADDSIKRRILFLANIHLWGKDKHRPALKSEVDVFGLESYFNHLLGLTENEHIRIVEHIFFREKDDIIGSIYDIPVDFPLELSMSVFMYGKSIRMQQEAFTNGLEILLLKYIPAHIQANVYIISDEVEMETTDQLYTNYCSDFSVENANKLKAYIVEKRKVN